MTVVWCPTWRGKRGHREPLWAWASRQEETAAVEMETGHAWHMQYGDRAKRT